MTALSLVVGMSESNDDVPEDNGDRGVNGRG